jgi:hypothetical protein
MADGVSIRHGPLLSKKLRAAYPWHRRIVRRRDTAKGESSIDQDKKD